MRLGGARPSRRPSARSRAERRPSSWGPLAPLLAAAAAFALFAPTLFFQFLNWDDDKYVLNNPWIRSWSADNLLHIFSKPYFSNFLPLHLLSYAFDYSVWKLNPFGYHLQSVFLHALNSALALIVVRRMIGGFTVPFLAALLFAVHPSHVEAVAWISIRKDLLSTTFALLTVYFYLVARREDGGSPRPAPYAASVICFTLALLAKMTVVTLPAFLLLLDRFPAKGAQSRGWGVDLVTKVPFALIGLWLAKLNYEAQAGAGATYVYDALNYAMVKGNAAWSYLGLLAGILRGSPDYDLPVLAKDPVTVLISIAGLIALPLAAWFAHRARDRALFLGTGWIFFTLVPALAFPLVTYKADRYLYLPSIGFCWILATWTVRASDRVAKPQSRRLALMAMLLIPMALFIGRTVQNLPVWRDSESLWTYAMTRCRDHRPYTNLAQVRLRQNRLQEAERLLLISATGEDDPNTFQNLGAVYFRMGRYAESVRASDRALQILRQRGWDPALASGLYYNLAAAHAMLGETEETVAALQAAIREDPTNEEARSKLSSIQSKPTPP